MSIDQKKMESLLQKIVSDLGPMLGSALVNIGTRLGLYEAIASAKGPVTPEELASATGTARPMIHEWLCQQAASGYVDYDSQTGRFSMTPEQKAIFVQEESPFFMQGAFEFVPVIYADLDKIAGAFRSGSGLSWGAHNEGCGCATAKFFKPTYSTHLVPEWIPALEGVKERMETGCAVADIGCGHGISTLFMARAFPNSRFVGFDYHEPSIEHAKANLAEWGAKNVEFRVASSKDYPGVYDVVGFFDSYHDMGDPVGIARHVRASLKPDGTCFLVEPFAFDTVEENLNPVGRVYYAGSTVFCTPCAMSQNGSEVLLGAQAGEKRTRQCFISAGFSTFRRAAETPFNIVYQARP